ncbi:response regulator [Flagellimonas onchidii]|uniref:response regulator n=1 Tax=Flagellimonas onchidii TaxID=2562684 RepID=UPI0010A626CF|nr:response regulator [Allomuricauda onchidii]
MTRELKILMVDDHPMTLKGYETTLTNVENLNIKYIDGVHSSDEAYLKIKSSNNVPYDIMLLDINLPPSLDKRFLDGEDLGIMIRKEFPSIKILVLTMLNDNYRIGSILKSINPNGFMVKSKLTPKKLQEALITIMADDCYYCEIVSNLVRKQVSNTVEIDVFDKKILYHLSLGERMKNLPKLIPLSMPTIERRKRKLKYLFEAKDDKYLLEKAKEKGFKRALLTFF